MGLLGLSKGVNGWAQEYVNTLPEDNCSATSPLTRADFEQNLLDETEACASYVKRIVLQVTERML